jgi:RHS repeat-associated protein
MRAGNGFCAAMPTARLLATPTIPRRSASANSPRCAAQPNFRTLIYTFDPIGNIVAVRNNADTAPIFSGATVVDGHGLYEYDPRYRLLSATGREHPGTQPVDIEPPGGSALPYNIPSANDLAALRNYTEKYSYDDADNITQVKHLAGPSNSAGWTRNYAYSQTGQPQTNNRLLRTSVPGAENDLSLAYSYDAHGSMSSMPHLQVMEWDYADRLTHTRPLASASDQDTHYTYDAAGQRVRKVHVASGVIKERIYLGNYEVYRERPAAPGSAVTRERQTLHLMDEARRVALVERKTREASSVIANPPLLWRFQLDNHLGSSMLELDEAGAIITYEECHPYGSTAFQTTNGNAEVSAKRYRYTGKERDAETGLYYYGARYYAPWLGRWTAADPAGVVDGLNLYEYAKNEPINLVDETGHQAGPYQPYIDINRFTAKLNQAVSAVTNTAPVQFALGVGDAAADTVTGVAAGVRDRLVRTGSELEAHPIAYAAAGPLAVSAAGTVSEAKHQVAEVKAKAAEQGGGARGWFVAVNQQWNPAYGIFEHGDKAIDAAKSGDWRAAGAETTHTGTSVLATAALAEGGAALAQRAPVPKPRAPAPKPHAPHPSSPKPKPHVAEPIVPEPTTAPTPTAPPAPASPIATPAAPPVAAQPTTTAPTGTNTTRLGVKRTNPADWRQLRDTWDQAGLGDILSDANRGAIAKGRTPVVDQAWIRHFPGDASLLGEKIPMHHIGGTPITVPLPASRHMDAHMPGGFRRNPGGPGRSG